MNQDHKYYNPNLNQLKIAFLAPTGFGKSTACNILKSVYNSENIKLAKPLYDIQKYYYKVLGVREDENKQDGELLQFLGNKIQREYPLFLSDKFFGRLKELSEKSFFDIITNDDCRPHNYKYLKEMGFVFVGINGFSRVRNDYSKINPANEVEWHGMIPFDYSVDNYYGLQEYRESLIGLVGKIYENSKL